MGKIESKTSGKVITIKKPKLKKITKKSGINKRTLKHKSKSILKDNIARNLEEENVAEQIIEADIKKIEEKKEQWNDKGLLSNDSESIKERRRIKREKRYLRKLEVKLKDDGSPVLEYLIKWKNDRDNWKFRKALQVKIVNSYLNEAVIPDEHFPKVLDYFQNMEGNARNLALGCAKLTIAASEDPVLKATKRKENSEECRVAPSKAVLARAHLVKNLLEKSEVSCSS